MPIKDLAFCNNIMALDKTTIMLLLLSAILAVNLYTLKMTIEKDVKSTKVSGPRVPLSKPVPMPIRTVKAPVQKIEAPPPKKVEKVEPQEKAETNEIKEE